MPSDAHQVVRLFAVAARAVCAEPASLVPITKTIDVICGRLVPPESHTAQECARLWILFSRVAQLPKEALRREAARAFCRDLDALGQRLQLAPLPEWLDLPEGMDEPGAVSLTEAGVAQARALSLVETAAEAKKLAAGTKALDASKVIGLLRHLEPQALRAWLDQMVGKGELGRSDVNLLVRQLVKTEGIGAHDTVLIEVLSRLGKALLR